MFKKQGRINDAVIENMFSWPVFFKLLNFEIIVIFTAKNGFEPNHAFRIGSSAWGLQFHPEYDEHAIIKGNEWSII